MTSNNELRMADENEPDWEILPSPIITAPVAPIVSLDLTLTQSYRRPLTPNGILISSEPAIMKKSKDIAVAQGPFL